MSTKLQSAEVRPENQNVTEVGTEFQQEDGPRCSTACQIVKISINKVEESGSTDRGQHGKFG